MLIGANLITNDSTLSILEVAPLVEAAGLHSIFQGEHSHIPIDTVYPGSAEGTVPDFYKRFPDLFVTLAAAAAVTTTLRLGTGVVLVAEHQPLRLAKAVASLDELSGGRVDFGVGYGWNAPEMVNNGVDPKRRRDVFGEHLRVISALWADDVVEHDGEWSSFTPSWSLPKPRQAGHRRPGPPILIGAAAGPKTFAARARPRRRLVPADRTDAARRHGPAAHPGRRAGRRHRGDRRRDGRAVPRRPVVLPTTPAPVSSCSTTPGATRTAASTACPSASRSTRRAELEDALAVLAELSAACRPRHGARRLRNRGHHEDR